MIEQNKFKFITFADNKDGTKIFCKLTYDKKIIIKGYYDFIKDKFFIIKYNKQNMIDNKIGKYTANKILKQIIIQDYDWTF